MKTKLFTLFAAVIMAANAMAAVSAFTNQTIEVKGVSFNMIAVEGGTFTMGATEEQGSDAYSAEKPTHQVTLSDYYIGATEVTQELWYAVMGQNPTESGSQWSDDYGLGDDYPAYYISWDDCQAFITKLNTLTGKTFRMPTEAEWEYAARGGNKSQGYKYSGSNTIDDVAWYWENSGSKNHTVGTKAANELGIYDMSGNVFEWCSDWYGSYSSDAQTNPMGATSGSERVRRGGYWLYDARLCRVSYRNYSDPSYRYNYVGLRLVLVPFTPEYVDLGLTSGTLWATCNVGATNPEQAGDYFAWGETEPKSNYDWSNAGDYKWGVYNSSDTNYGMTKYNKTNGKTVLDPADDAATANWGGDWRMPTKAEQDELRTECTWSWDSTKKGYTVTGKNGNSIFLPAAGYRDGTDEPDGVGTDGYYWSSSLYKYYPDGAGYLDFNSSDFDCYYINRCFGQSVRPVQSPKYTITATANDAAYGTVTGGGEYASGSTAVLTAVPNAWYAFAGWSDGNTDNPRTITIAADAMYTAKFVKRDVSDNLVTNGDVSDGNTGWTIEGKIQHSAGMLETSYTEGKITQEIDLLAKGFTPDELDDNPQLYVGGDVMVPDYNRGREGLVKIVVRCLDASRDTLSTITLRDDNPITVGNPWTTYYQLVTLPQATRYLSFDLAGKDISYWGGYYGPKFDNLVAKLYSSETTVYNISVIKNIDNYDCRAGVSGYYPAGSEQIITATPAEHYKFVSWNDGDTNAERTITVSGDATYTATFAPIMFTITATANDAAYGTVTGGGTFKVGTSITLTATPDEGYTFVNWTDAENNVVGTDEELTITVTADATYTATFVKNTPTALDDIRDSMLDTRKVFENGTIYILRNSETYTIDGRKVE